MKIILLFAFCLFFNLISCSFQIETIKDYYLNIEKSITIGSPLFQVSTGRKPKTYPKILSGYGYEMIYVGCIDGRLKLLYREYTIDETNYYIKGEFSQLYEYDLTKSKQISFRQFIIRVKNCDNEYLNYIIISDNL